MGKANLGREPAFALGMEKTLGASTPSKLSMASAPPCKACHSGLVASISTAPDASTSVQGAVMTMQAWVPR